MTAPQGARPPVRAILEGRYARLEPLAPRHAEDVLMASSVPDAAQRFAYIPDPPSSPEGIRTWIAQQSGLDDPILFAVVDKATGRAEDKGAV